MTDEKELRHIKRMIALSHSVGLLVGVIEGLYPSLELWQKRRIKKLLKEANKPFEEGAEG